MTGGAQQEAATEAEDRLSGWEQMWSGEMTGWHEKSVNRHLDKFLNELLPCEMSEGRSSTRVLFPLCGKTVDMAWLSQRGYSVLGIDGVKQAIDEFAAENSEAAEATPIAVPKDMDAALFKAFSVTPSAEDGSDAAATPEVVSLILGDFFALKPSDVESLGPFDAAFDRGSLVAIDPSIRPKYMQIVASLMAPGGRVLLQAVEHDEFTGGRLGPPFEVTPAQVEELCAGLFDVKFLDKEDRLEHLPGMRAAGVTRYSETVYLLRRLGGASNEGK